MNNIVILMLVISYASLIIDLYFLIDRKHFLIFFKYNDKIRNVLVCISFISAVLSIVFALMGTNLGHDRESLFIFMSAFPIVCAILKLFSNLFGTKKSSNLFLLKKGTYEVFSVASLDGNRRMIRNCLETTIDGKKVMILFNGIAPEAGRDIYIKYYASDSESDLLIANTYMYEKSSKFEILDLILTMSVIGVFIYGLYFVLNHSGNFPIPDEITAKFPYNVFGLCIAYFIFRFGFFATKNCKDSYVKFIHYAFMIFYILMMLLILFSPFI